MRNFSLVEKLKKQFKAVLLCSALLMMGVPGDGAAPPADPAADPPAAPPADNTPPAEETYEQLTAQAKELSNKAEEVRRSKLTDEERKAEDDAKAADTVPEEYSDFTMPEGMPADEQQLNDFKPLAKEMGLSQAKAQQLIDLYADKVLPAMGQRQADAWQQTLDGWVQEAKSDKEIGGDNFDVALSDAQRVINTLGTPELKGVLDRYGLGNNPELIRVFSRVAPQLREDSMIHVRGVAPARPSTPHDVYPYMNP